MTSTPRRQILGLAGWLALVFIVGAIGAWASVDAASFYAALTRPVWAPPATVFGPVWTALYIMMGVAAWLVWREGPSPVIRRALVLFVAQLILNVLWSWLFFGWHLGALAFLDIMVLLVLVVLAYPTIGRLADASLSRLGRLRVCAQLLGLAAESSASLTTQRRLLYVAIMVLLR